MPCRSRRKEPAGRPGPRLVCFSCIRVPKAPSFPPGTLSPPPPKPSLPPGPCLPQGSERTAAGRGAGLRGKTARPSLRSSLPPPRGCGRRGRLPASALRQPRSLPQPVPASRARPPRAAGRERRRPRSGRRCGPPGSASSSLATWPAALQRRLDVKMEGDARQTNFPPASGSLSPAPLRQPAPLVPRRLLLLAGLRRGSERKPQWGADPNEAAAAALQPPEFCSEEKTTKPTEAAGPGKEQAAPREAGGVHLGALPPRACPPPHPGALPSSCGRPLKQGRTEEASPRGESSRCRGPLACSRPASLGSLGGGEGAAEPRRVIRLPPPPPACHDPRSSGPARWAFLQRRATNPSGVQWGSGPAGQQPVRQGRGMGAGLVRRFLS